MDFDEEADFDPEEELVRYASYDNVDEEAEAETQAKLLEESLDETMKVAKKLNVKRLRCISHLVRNYLLCL